MSLDFTDLQVMEQIIRTCQTRGAFRMEEMPSIVTLYQKILSILQPNTLPYNTRQPLSTIAEEKTE